MSVRQCYLCLTVTISTAYTPYCEIHGKVLCLACRAAILSADLPPSPEVLPTPTSSIPIYLETDSFEPCKVHDFALTYVCEEAGEAGCQFCINEHPERRYTDLKEEVENGLVELHRVEYLARVVLLRRLDAGAAMMREEMEEIGREVRRNNSFFDAYQVLHTAVPHYWRQLQSLYPSFQPFTPQQALASLPLHRPSDHSSLLHWSQWGGSTVHFLDLETRSKERLDLDGDFHIPLFSRTLLLPDGDVFLCGGRTEANAFSLNSCWKIPRSSSKSIEKLPDLLYGRSNHWALLHLNYIYVLAGCDQNNKFTNKCERFSLLTQTWELIAGTNETRDSVCAVADSRFDWIYTAGGRVDNGILADSIERYEIHRNVWVTLPMRLPYPVSMQGLVLLPGSGTRLLLFGGLNAANQAIKRVTLIDIDREDARELKNMSGNGGCVVDVPVVYAGSVHTLVFAGFTARTWERWRVDWEDWENLPTYRT